MKTDRINLISGAMFAMFGVAALVLSASLPIGTAARMGPGYFPRALGILLVAVGLIVAFATKGDRRSDAPRIAWRPLVSLTLATVLFAVLLPKIGLLLTLVTMSIVSRLARPEFRWRETAALAVAVALLCAAIFHYGLGVQLPMWPTLA